MHIERTWILALALTLTACGPGETNQPTGSGSTTAAGGSGPSAGSGGGGDGGAATGGGGSAGTSGSAGDAGSGGAPGITDPVTPRFTGGNYFSLFVDHDGDLWSWGRAVDDTLLEIPDAGACGAGNSCPATYQCNAAGTCEANTIYPHKTTTTGVRQVAAGQYHAVALLDGGKVVTWGFSTSGQLGVGDPPADHMGTPTEVDPIPNAARVYAGANQTYVLTTEGEVWAWGNDSDGELGLGNPSPDGGGSCVNNWGPANPRVLTPQKIPNFSGVQKLFVGPCHVLALMADGSVWGFGNNHDGQLGPDVGLDASSPTELTFLGKDNTGVTGTEVTSNVQKADGSFFSFGASNLHGLCQGAEVYKPGGGTYTVGDVVAITHNANTTYYLKKDGTLWGCGENGWGQVGDGTWVSTGDPTQTKGLADVVAFNTGTVSGHVFAVTKGGATYMWGYNRFGMLGDGRTSDGYHPMNEMELEMYYANAPVSVPVPW